MSIKIINENREFHKRKNEIKENTTQENDFNDPTIQAIQSSAKEFLLRAPKTKYKKLITGDKGLKTINLRSRINEEFKNSEVLTIEKENTVENTNNTNNNTNNAKKEDSPILSRLRLLKGKIIIEKFISKKEMKS